MFRWIYDIFEFMHDPAKVIDQHMNDDNNREVPANDKDVD